MRLQHIRRWPSAWKAFLSACCCKNESEIGFLIVTSSLGYQHGFSAKASQFLSNAEGVWDVGSAITGIPFVNLPKSSTTS